jgi:hypothetical protein
MIPLLTISIDFDVSFGKDRRAFLRQIVADAPDDSVRAFAGELPGMCPESGGDHG